MPPAFICTDRQDRLYQRPGIYWRSCLYQNMSKVTKQYCILIMYSKMCNTQLLIMFTVTVTVTHKHVAYVTVTYIPLSSPDVYQRASVHERPGIYYKFFGTYLTLLICSLQNNTRSFLTIMKQKSLKLNIGKLSTGAHCSRRVSVRLVVAVTKLYNNGNDNVSSA